MEKKLKINAGSVMLLNDRLESLDNYDAVDINAGSLFASSKAYAKLIGMGVSINSGNINVLDIEGELVELPGNTVITASASYAGCYLFCEGNLIVEDAKGLDGITGLYANAVFRPESAERGLSAVKGMKAGKIVYPDGAKLIFADLTLGEDSHITLEGGALYWAHGDITALDEGAAEKLRSKNTRFRCNRLTIYRGLYEKYGDMFRAGGYTLIPDGYAVAHGISLDAATSLLYGEKLFVLGDMMIEHDQARHLNGFSSLIVNGTVTMPVSAAASFKAVGKANGFNLYEGILTTVNGVQTFGHGQFQSAISEGLTYSVNVNGVALFLDDVTAEDMDAIAAISCNGVMVAPGRACGALDGKVKCMNGTMLNFEMFGNIFDIDDPIGFLMKIQDMLNGGGDDDENVKRINVGSMRL